uniref:FACT complex subunit n=2 Tax=Clytia hemisphaerica TaxID=252671 RepID=A0A7M5XAC7_9CNID
MILCESHIYFLASKKKIEFLKPVQDGQKKMENIPPITLLLRNKGDNDSENFKTLINSIKESKEGKKVGVFVKDKFAGDFSQAWKKVYEDASFEKTDISPSMAYVMSSKDENEITTIKKAAHVTSVLFDKFFKQQVVKIVDEEKSVKHSKLADQIEQALDSKKYLGQGMDPDQVEMCYSPIIQSGGKFNLKFSAVSSDEKLNFGVITCSLGVRYKFYCSNIVRTLMVEPTQEQQDLYNYLLTLLDFILGKLKPGAKLSEVYASAVKQVEKTKPELKENFVKNIGFATGIEFREGSLLIDQKHNQKIRKGMVFNISLGFTNLKNKSAKENANKVYALFLGETVAVSDKDTAAIVLTTSKKQMKNIGMFLKDPEEGEDEEDEVKIDEKFLPEKKQRDISAEIKRKDHQRELAQQINEEARRRLLDKQNDNDSDKKTVRNTVAYKNNNLIPRDNNVQELTIFVDRKYEAIILPLFGIPTPFHISTIKNVSTNVEGDSSYLRINFYCPGSSYGRSDGNIFSNPDSTFVKELVYRSSNIRVPGESHPPAENLNKALRMIKEVQKRYKTRAAEEKEREGVVKQEDLILHKGKGNPKLRDLYVRPQLTSRKCVGSLEAHVNGFRYQNIKGDKIDILYKNVKHAFFQPCDGEMIIVLHFHLKHPIIIGKKKYRDVQMFTEVGELVTDLGGKGHHNMRDRDDLAAEQAERELRARLKSAFKTFIEKIEGLTHGVIEFDIPFRELGFSGVPFKSTVLLQPTTHCVVSFTEQPPFIITLDDLELVHFERVQFHMKNFDMIFVFKEYTRKVSMISAIPMTSLDSVKEWLNSCDIKYTEGIQSLNWTKIMKTINDNPEDFFENGGWSFLEPNSEDEAEAEDDDDEDDDEFVPESDEESEDDDEDEEYDSGDDESDIDDSDYEDDFDSDESSGKGWSELEEEAKRDDREREREIIQPSSKHSKRKREPSPPRKSKKKKR